MSLTSQLSAHGAFLALAALLTAGCSIRTLAVNRLGDALAGGGEVFASDDDPELVGEALPFTLKLIESLLAESPRHQGLLLAASRGFTQYAYGWVEPRVPLLQPTDPDAAAMQETRARRLYLRARDYGLRGLAVAHPQFGDALRADAPKALLAMKRNDIPLLYWTASSWGLAISLSKDDPEAVADLPLVEATIDRALALDETWGEGAIQAFLVSYEPSRAGGEGDPYERARRHFDRAVELSGGKLASPFVALAESVSVPKQDVTEFRTMLERALKIDPAAAPAHRLENLLSQKRARWLRAHENELFISEPEEVTP